MLPGVLALLLVAMLVGLLLVCVGLRGRTINDHPACRQCHFDLFGIYPEVTTCPECGSGLKRDNAVLAGMRKKMPIVAAIGVLLVLTPLVPVGAVTFAALTGRDVNSYKPLGLIMWEAKHADAKSAGKLAEEVMNRILSQKLSASQYDYVITSILKVQGDLSTPWFEPWGAIIERAEIDGALKPAQETLFKQQAAVLAMTARKTLHAGAVLPVEVKLKEARVAPGTIEPLSISLASATIDGQPLTRRPEQHAEADSFFGNGFFIQRGVAPGATASSSDPAAMGTILLRGSRPQGRFMGMGGQDFDGTLALDLPKDLPPGTHTLNIDLALTPESAFQQRMVIVNGQVHAAPGPQPETRHVQLAVQVEIVPDSVAVAAPKSLNDEERGTLTTKLTPAAIDITQSSGYVAIVNGVRNNVAPETRAAVRFNIKDLPQNIAYDVFLRSNGVEQRLGELTSGTLADQGVDSSDSSFSSVSFTMTINGVTQTSSNSSDSKDQRTVSAKIDPIQGDNADIILRPSQNIAASTLDIDSYADAELVLTKVPIRQNANGVDPWGTSGDPFAEMNQRMQQQQDQMMRDLQRWQQRFGQPPTRRAPSQPATKPPATNETTPPNGPA